MMTTPEERKTVREAFLKWDSNHTGFLSAEELQEHMAEICEHFHLQEPDVQKMIRAADV